MSCVYCYPSGTGHVSPRSGDSKQAILIEQSSGVASGDWCHGSGLGVRPQWSALPQAEPCIRADRPARGQWQDQALGVFGGHHNRPCPGNLPTHDHEGAPAVTTKRQWVTGLFAAFNIADGTVISELHHRHQEYLKFLKRIDRNVPAELDVHVVCDNYGTHKTPPSRNGWPGTPASTSTSPRPDHRG